MSSFFTIPASQRKRKQQENSGVSSSKRRSITTSGSSTKSQPANRTKAKTAQKVADEDDESISGSDSEQEGSRINGQRQDEDDSGSEDDAQETAAERRLKLAERYLENIRNEIGEEQEVGFDAADVDRELIAARLKEDVAEEKGHMYRFIAGELDFRRATQTFFRADTLSTTGVAVCPPYAYTVSKDMKFIKWQIATPSFTQNTSNGSTKQPNPMRRKPKQLLYTRGNKNKSKDLSYMHHTAQILCVAASTSGKFVATGGADRKLIIWDASTLTPLRVFTQHRDSVTGVAFRGKTHQLFSASKDRTIKIWSLDELAYIETLFGHQDEVVDVTSVGGKEERCISVGARDRSARLWKVVEESQLVFRGGGGGGGSSSSSHRKPKPTDLAPTTPENTPPVFHEGSLDTIAQPSTSLFITGSDSGALSLFALHKKKPLHTVPLAHGFDPAIPASLSNAEFDFEAAGTKAGPTPRWITALASVPFSDLVISGSWDGVIRCWRIGSAENSAGKKLEAVGVLGAAPSEPENRIGDTAEDDVEMDGEAALVPTAQEATPQSNEIGSVPGIVNSLAVFHRTAAASSSSKKITGVCIVAGIGTENRLGRWVQKKEGRNGMVVFEVPMARLVLDDASAVKESGGM